jgi:nicotinate-nucleotide adenylyltransferase
LFMQSLNKHKKIGLLGGTFDPVHNGHLAVAHHVRNVLDLDAVWFIPAAQPPHKAGHVDNLEISDFAHRFAMLERAVSPDSSFIVSDIESKRSAPSYSIDTINILRQLTDEEMDFSFIIGVDAFLEIDTWKCFKELPTLVDFIIISRPGYLPDKVKQVIRRYYPYYRYDQSLETWSSPTSQGKFVLLHMTPVPISSTEIRDKVRKGDDISGMVPTAVESYITEHKLYTSCR